MDQQRVLDDVRWWTSTYDNVRLVVLTGSMAREGHAADELSDLDIALQALDTPPLLMCEWMDSEIVGALGSCWAMAGQWCKRSIESCAWPAALADNQTHRVRRGGGASRVTNRSVTNRNPGMREGPIPNLASTLELTRPRRDAIESTPR